MTFTPKDIEEFNRSLDMDCGCSVKLVTTDRGDGGLVLEIQWHPCSALGHEEKGKAEVMDFCLEHGLSYEFELDGVQHHIPSMTETETPEAWAELVAEGIRKHWRLKGRKVKCGVYCVNETRSQAVRDRFTSLELVWVDIEIMDKGPEAL